MNQDTPTAKENGSRTAPWELSLLTVLADRRINAAGEEELPESKSLYVSDIQDILVRGGLKACVSPGLTLKLVTVFVAMHAVTVSSSSCFFY